MLPNTMPPNLSNHYYQTSSSVCIVCQSVKSAMPHTSQGIPSTKYTTHTCLGSHNMNDRGAVSLVVHGTKNPQLDTIPIPKHVRFVNELNLASGVILTLCSSCQHLPLGYCSIPEPYSHQPPKVTLNQSFCIFWVNF